MRKPDFFLAGAPRCGTTAWSEYLRRHPRIFFSTPKETHYFSDGYPFRGTEYINDLKTYQRIFQAASDRHVAVGEGSVWYLYSATALHRIRDYNPAARLLITLRNPVDMLRSQHAFLVLQGAEPEADFAAAWRRQDEHPFGTHLPRGADFNPMYYRDFGRFGKYVAQALEIFPREQVHVTIFDDFLQNPRTEYLKVLAFLGVPDDGRKTFPRFNEYRVPRVPALDRLLTRPPGWARAANNALKAALGVPHLPWQKLRRITGSPAKVPAAPAGIRAEIADALAADTETLGKLLGRDMSGWYDTSATSRA